MSKCTFFTFLNIFTFLTFENLLQLECSHSVPTTNCKLDCNAPFKVRVITYYTQCTVKLQAVRYDSGMNKALFNDHLFPAYWFGYKLMVQYLSKLNPNQNKLSHNENQTLSWHKLFNLIQTQVIPRVSSVRQILVLKAYEILLLVWTLGGIWRL